MRSDPTPCRAFFPLLLLVALAACVSPAPKPRPVAIPGTQRDPPTLEQQVRELEQGSTPGPEHRELDRFAGLWKVTLSSLAPDDAETTLATGDAVIGWVLDQRYLRWDAALEIGGKRRETSGFLGFDRKARQYVQLTVTSLSTGMGIARGVGEPKRGGIRLSLEQVDPSSGALVRMTSLLRALDEDHFVLDQTAVDAAGIERVVRRTHYRRAGATTGATK